MQTRKRLDVALVERGLESTRARAQARILAGDVVVGEHRVDKAGHLVSASDPIRLKNNSLPYVSRGGLKLKAALETWPMKIKDAIAIDVGASTGGFTDVLLQENAQLVYAVDVGTNQLAYSIRNHPLVRVFEQTHILKVPVGTFEPKPSVAVVDLSFISLERVLPALLPHLEPSARLYLLVKPQFEVRREQIGKGGIVRDAAVRQGALARIQKIATQLGLLEIGHRESPIQGTDGNTEFLACYESPAGISP
ncbi:MAG: TlyA family RNA methyltransferase [Myxococcaceae bacterium]|nr:TlyA family RNA methyltransferase [Myxococcaceae bacterium]MBH2005742.1 TlyA family RNA methyltransferase [Myxococcaceae bacterium]